MICQHSLIISTKAANHLANKYAREYKSVTLQLLLNSPVPLPLTQPYAVSHGR